MLCFVLTSVFVTPLSSLHGTVCSGAFWSFFGHFLLSELELQRVCVPPTEPEV